ncbi:MAG: histidine kinase [Hydrogenophilales bacterium 28-61-23]|nr:MAG: histidine kinase [Hydrogenophilales bacterium 28-61-23]
MSCALLCILCLAWVGQVRAEAPLILNSADFVLDASEHPPADSAGWHPQALPDSWPVNHPAAVAENAHGGWYRFRFSAPAAFDPLQAVYLPKLGLNAAVYLNGRLIGSGGRFNEPYGRHWNRPLLFLLPPGALSPGQNTLHVRLLSHAYTQANLHPILIGSDRILRPKFEREILLRVTLNQTASLLIASMGVLMLSLWWRRRRDVAYGYFGISALLWAAQSTNLYLREAPLATAHWEIVINSSFQVFSAFLLVSLLRFSAAGGQPLLPLLWISVVASPLTQILVPARHYLTLTAFWHVFTLLCAFATLLFLLRAAIKWHNRDAGLMSGAMGMVVVLAGHDWLMHSQHFWLTRPNEFLEDIYLLHYSAPLVFLAVGMIMTSRFVHVLNEFEALNDELEDRVQAKHAQLQDSFTRMSALEMDQAVAEERERIYRDLHDDVGAKLLSLVYRAGTPESADLARSALQDLRDVVSTTQQGNPNLAAACADWRAECEQRLSEAGIVLDWQQPADLEAYDLTQPQAINLGRILREAVSNLIKHAQANHASVRIDLETGVGGGSLSLTIRDDGIGCGGAAPRPPGRGVRNMEQRAMRIGALFSRESRVDGGCEILLRLPFAAVQGSGFSPPST